MVYARLAASVLVGTFCPGLVSAAYAGLDDTSILMQRDAQRRAASLEVDASTLEIDRAISDMRSGVDRLVAGTADVLREASANAAGELTQGLVWLSGSPVSLIEEGSAQAPGPKVPFKEQLSDFKQRTGDRVSRVVTGINKGVSTVNARLEHSVGSMMSKANSAVDDVHSAASNALQGVKDFTDAASEPVSTKVNTQSALFNGKVKVMIGKINHAIDDMKGGMRDLAHGVTEGMKEASEKIAAQLAQSVHEHVRQEIELARAAEPASLLEVEARHNGGAVMSKAHSAVYAIRTAANHALDGMKELVDAAGESAFQQVSHSADIGSEVDDMISRTDAAIGEMRAIVRGFAAGTTDSLREAGERITAELARTVGEHLPARRAGFP